MKKSSEIFITNINSSKTKSTNETSNISNRLSKKDNKETEKEKITENFFDYLINENSNFANFEKVTEYYEKKLHQNKNIYDLNLNIIKNKKEEIKNLKIKICNVILNNIKLEDKEMDLYYERSKEKLKKEITLTEHELEVYKNSFNEIYRSNYTLTSRLEKENKTEKIFEEQHEKYINLKEAALNKLLKQQEMLKTLNFYFEKCERIHQTLYNKKQIKLKQLNYEIHVLKKDEVTNEETLKLLSEKNNKLNNYLQNQKMQYSLYLKDFKLCQKNYIKDSLNINEIYETSKEQNIDCIINEYNKLKNTNKKLSNLFTLRTKKMINLNSSFTSLQNEFNYLKKSIRFKILREKEETKNNIMSHSDYIDKINIITNRAKSFISEKNDVFTNKMKLLINIINSSLKLISNINHSRNISVKVIEGLKSENRNHIIEKYQHYFDNIFTFRYKINFNEQFMNVKFIKFLVFIINELSFQIKSIISNVYQILFERRKEMRNKRRKALVDMQLFEQIQTSNNKRKISEEILENNKNKKLISNFDVNEYIKLYDDELKIKKKKIEERKQFFEQEEKELIKNKINNLKKYKEDENNIILPSIDREKLNYNKNNRSSECISTHDFISQYYKYYNQNKQNTQIAQDFSTMNNMNNSMDSNQSRINLNKFNFLINYTNDFVSSKKEMEDKKILKYQQILIKSKKIKEENEKKEISKYLKKSVKIKKMIREQYKQNISTDSEKEEKAKKDELALQLITKELAEIKKPKKYLLKYSDKEVSKIYERFDDIRTLELNFLKNKGNFLIDSGFFNEYYFKLKKQFNENKMKLNNSSQINNKKIMIKPIKNMFENKRYKNLSRPINNVQSLFNERCKSDRNSNNTSRKIILKKINKNILNRNNSEVLFNNLRNITNRTTISKKME